MSERETGQTMQDFVSGLGMETVEPPSPTPEQIRAAKAIQAAAKRMMRARGGGLSSSQLLAYSVQCAIGGWTTESLAQEVVHPDFEDWMGTTMSVMAFFIGAVPEEARTEMLIQLAAAFTPLGQSMRMDNAASHSAGGTPQ